MENNLPHIIFTYIDLQILKQATALFTEALGRNNKALPNMNLAVTSLHDLQQKIDDLLLQSQPAVEFDFNETVIIVAALTMYQIDILFSKPSETMRATLKNCQSMIAYFTAIQRQPQPD